MATKNKKAVMAYLSPELERFVADYCDSKGLTFTKDNVTQPRLGTGIIELLESLRLGGNTLPGEVKDPDHGLSERLSKVESELRGSLGNLEERIGGFDVRLTKTEQNLAIANETQTKLISVVNGNSGALKELKQPIDLSTIEARLKALEKGRATAAPQPQTEPAESLLSRFKDGQIYSQTQLTELLKHPGKTPQSIEIRKWIKEGRECLDETIAPIIPHLTFSHSDGKNKPNFYRFTAAGQSEQISPK